MAISDEQIWEQVLKLLEERLSRPTFETWFKDATLDRLDVERIIILAPNAFVMSHLQKHYLDAIADVVTGSDGQNFRGMSQISARTRSSFSN